MKKRSTTVKVVLLFYGMMHQCLLHLLEVSVLNVIVLGLGVLLGTGWLRLQRRRGPEPCGLP